MKSIKLGGVTLTKENAENVVAMYQKAIDEIQAQLDAPDESLPELEAKVARLEAGQQAAIDVALENLAREFTFREGAYYLSSLEVQKKIRSHIKGGGQ